MKARKFGFDLLQNSQSNSNTARYKVTTQLKNMSSHQNEENNGRKANLANSLGAGYASYLKQFFV